MTRLYLVRHAIAEAADPARWPDDSLRPLSERGVRRFIEAAAGVEALGLVPDVAYTSPFLRTRMTAELLEAHAAWPEARETSALVEGDLVTLVQLVRTNASSVGLVGHLPELVQLASWLLAGDREIAFDWRRGALAVIEVGAPAPGGGELVAFLPPRVLRARRR